ncbi:MAG: hypothetical protein DWI00_04155 [Planctomycetota bacterium]|nr:MAG: hypothetical protein DWI00_04155 [Planctomycetota bacterium]
MTISFRGLKYLTQSEERTARISEEMKDANDYFRRTPHGQPIFDDRHLVGCDKFAAANAPGPSVDGLPGNVVRA